MALILNGTLGLSDVDGSAATPAIRGTDTNTGIFFPAADTIAFAEGGVESARLDSSGNLGLGVTPSAWTTVTPVFQVGRASLYGFSNEVRLSANFFFNGADRYIANDFATSYNQANGAHKFFTATSGTAGDAISFTQAATLTAAGTFLVGTTSFAASAPPDKGITGGNFRSIYNIAVIGASATETILTLSSTATGVYIINVNFGGQGNEIYGGMLIVVANLGSFRIVTNGGGSSSTLSMSGANVQITNAVGVPLDATASAIFIGNGV